MARASFNHLIQQEKLTLVDFSADWCGPCKMMNPVLTELKSLIGDQATVIKVDIDRNPEVASAYHVRNVPTLMLFKGGRKLWQQSGVIPAAYLRRVMEQHQ